MENLGWALCIIGTVFVVLGLLLGVWAVAKDLLEGPRTEGFTIPGLGEVIKELVKKPWGLIAATGLVLLIIGLVLLGVEIN